MENSERTELTPIIEEIVKMINKEEVDEKFVERVLKRLLSFGYKINHEEDTWVICFCIQKVEKDIINFCNISKVPEGLEEIEINRICGEVLFSKKQTGKLNTENGFDVETAIKQVQAGDTNVVFATGEGSETLETKLNSLIAYLLNCGESDLICYRQLKW